MKKIIFILGVALALLTVTFSVFAQNADANNSVYTGWNCENPKQPEHCTRILQKGENAWNFAGVLFNNSLLWTEFQKDNLDKTKVAGSKEQPILLWTAGDEIRIRKSALSAIAKGEVKPDNPNPIPVTIQWNESSSWFWLLLPFAIFGLIVAALVAAVLLYLASRNNQERRLNPNNADSGRSMRNRVLHTLRVPQTCAEAVTMVSRLHSQRAGLTGRAGSLNRVVRATLTLPSHIAIPTEFRDGIRNATANGNSVHMGIFYRKAEGNQYEIADVTLGYQYCANGAVLSRLSDADKALFVHNAEWGNPTVIYESSDAPQPFNFEQVLEFLRQQVAASTQSDVVAQESANPIDFSVVETLNPDEALDAPISSPVSQPSTATPNAMKFDPVRGLTIKGGVIDLGKGASLVLQDEASITVDREGKIFINDSIPFDDLGATPDTLQ